MSTRIVSPRSLNQAYKPLQEAKAGTLWGPSDTFGPYLLRLREKSNLSLRAAAAVLGVSHTHLASMEQYGLDRPPPFDLLTKIAELYSVAGTEVLHEAGYRYEMTDELIAAIQRTEEEDFIAVMTCPEFGFPNFTVKDLDLFPASVWSHVVNLVRRVDTSARKGGPTVSTVLSRGRNKK